MNPSIGVLIESDASITDDSLALSVEESATVGGIDTYGAFGRTSIYAVIPISQCDKYLSAVIISHLYGVVIGCLVQTINSSAFVLHPYRKFAWTEREGASEINLTATCADNSGELSDKDISGSEFYADNIL